MKKLIISIMLVLAACSLKAQEEETSYSSAFDDESSSISSLSFKSKNGHEVLPKAGDWALGVDVFPFLEYVGNSFNGSNSNNSPSFQGVDKDVPSPAVTVYGKLFTADDFAYRASISLNVYNLETTFRVDDDDSTDPDAFLFDRRRRSNSGVTITGGFEKRRGKSRIQGIYGAEAYVSFVTNETWTNTYANEMNISNQSPTSAAIRTQVPGGFNVPIPDEVTSLGGRITKVVQNNVLEAGIRGFGGVEYFFAPKMSIGGEFFIGAGVQSVGAESVTAEAFNPVNNTVEEHTNESEGTFGFNVGTGNFGGSINLLFYF